MTAPLPPSGGPLARFRADLPLDEAALDGIEVAWSGTEGHMPHASDLLAQALALRDRCERQERLLAASQAEAAALRAGLGGVLLSALKVEDVYSGLSPREFVRKRVCGVALGPETDAAYLAAEAALAAPSASEAALKEHDELMFLAAAQEGWKKGYDAANLIRGGRPWLSTRENDIASIVKTLLVERAGGGGGGETT